MTRKDIANIKARENIVLSNRKAEAEEVSEGSVPVADNFRYVI